MTPLSPALRALIHAGTPAILVRVSRALGSTPREAGAAMIVTRETSQGTVGGGALELAGVERARAMLTGGAASDRLAIPLGPAIGQCCGGHVTLTLQRLDAALLAAEIEAENQDAAHRPTVLIFGAGHTGRALAQALLPLPLQLTTIDTRREAMANWPAGIKTRVTPLPEAEVETAPPGSAFLVMTHDHALDFLIGAAALGRGDAAYVGMIGSATKREKFRRYLLDAGEGHLIDGLTLPIGGGRVRDKRPEVIAALTAADLIEALLCKAEEKLGSGFSTGTSQCNSELVEPQPKARPLPKACNARAS
jgi:xanthine dehydrogenase accessory factor